LSNLFIWFTKEGGKPGDPTYHHLVKKLKEVRKIKESDLTWKVEVKDSEILPNNRIHGFQPSRQQGEVGESFTNRGLEKKEGVSEAISKCSRDSNKEP